MIKKFIRVDPVRSVVMTLPPQLIGGAFYYGKIGSGKTTAMLSSSQRYHDLLGYKIIDLFGGQRNEHLYWTLPSINDEYWERVKKILNVNPTQEASKQYSVNLLYPLFATKLPDELPQNKPFVKSKIFTIPFKDIVLDDIRLVINNISSDTRYCWEEVTDQLKRKEDGIEVEQIIHKLDGENKILWKSFLRPLIKEQLLQSEKCDFNLDVLKEMKDRETISVVCLDFVPPVYHLFIMGWFCRKIKELLDEGKLQTKNIILMREMSEFFRATDDSIVDDRFKFFRRLLSGYIRYGRRGMHFFGDCQSPSEVRGIVEGSQDLTFLGRIAATSRRDREEIANSLATVGKMTKSQIRGLNDLRRGEFYLVEGYKDVRKIYILLPRSAYWQEGDGNFYSQVWKKYVNQYINIKDDVEELREDYERRHREMMENRKFKESLVKNVKPKRRKKVEEVEREENGGNGESEEIKKIDKSENIDNDEFEEKEIIGEAEMEEDDTWLD